MPFAAGTDLALTRMTMPDGRRLYAEAVRLMSQCATNALAAAGLAPADVSRFVPHQANSRIFGAVARNVGLVETKTVSSIAEYGNSSAATIPLTLSLASREKPIQHGETLLLAAAGAGLTGGALVLRA